MRLILPILITLIFSLQTYAMDKNSNSFIRVLLGDKRPSSNELEKIKKVAAKTIVNGSAYHGEIEIWKGNEGYFLINVIQLEDYVKGVVASEVGIHWPEEALKAQAVLARTYAVAHILRNRTKNFYDVTSSVFHQVYKEDEGTEEVEKAVRETKGQILSYNGEPVMAFYHACSVEKTEEPKEVFGKEYPYLKSVEVPSTPSPYTLWEKKISFEILEKVLSMTKISYVKIASYTTTGRVKELEFSDGKNKKLVKATELRRLLQWTALPSTMITSIRIEDDGIVFEGKGYGHGVGMCQWCAFQMAQEGKNYKEILQYFYPGTEINIINENN
ncbi:MULTISPECIES: SpoIID/LytB domain-containing protein [Thermodesulfovibrio]|uniref:Cytoplasmic membrane protein n=2 Tax=Thermodesulfovibrio yellowstonii TaxID=28262 RepID=B5YKE6_THEYD|nr:MULTISPECIES: SpoIID/LytB domain-containing protein [Thermodesulfovibrio]ACI21894.1 cytoplasmic membrane protein [Thermodesulfovibrio yellowstonii DSM 11347]MDI6865741.1 SpoIID/LytB domain-containing protein [Thermodesulfovibrio yellowstonii]